MSLKEFKLSEIAELKKETYRPNSSDKIPYIGLEHIEPGGLRLIGIGSSDQISSQKFKFYTDDILYGKLRPYFQKVAFPRFNGICSTDIFVIKAKEKVCPRFLFYLLGTPRFTELANSSSTGTRMPRADWAHLKNTTWKIPSLSKQQEIAEILSSLDDKIELNNKINAELETLSNTIFKRWFIDFEFPDENSNPYKSSGGKLVDINNTKIPEGWTTVQFKDLATVKYGKDHKNQAEGKYPVFGSGGLMRNINNYLYDSPSILIPRKGTLTNIMRVLEPFWTVDTMFYTEIHNPRNLNYLYYYLIKENLSERNVGSAVPSLTAQIINSVSVILPNSEIIEKFEMLISDSLKLSQQNSKENYELLELRDLLIQKLIAKVV